MKIWCKAKCLICLLALAITMIAGVAVAEEPIEAKALWQAFQDNQQAAASKYFTNQVTVTGIVVEAGMSIYATPAVRLSDTRDGEVLVICVLPRVDALNLSNFKVGDRVTFVGTVRHNNRGTVVIKECRSVHNHPRPQ
jgi:hypothetical protein